MRHLSCFYDSDIYKHTSTTSFVSGAFYIKKKKTQYVKRRTYNNSTQTRAILQKKLSTRSSDAQKNKTQKSCDSKFII